jgi:hypothetical protein
MKIKVVVHKAEEGGFWAEVPATPGCALRQTRLKSYFKTSMKESQERTFAHRYLFTETGR